MAKKYWYPDETYKLMQEVRGLVETAKTLPQTPSGQTTVRQSNRNTLKTVVDQDDGYTGYQDTLRRINGRLSGLQGASSAQQPGAFSRRTSDTQSRLAAAQNRVNDLVSRRGAITQNIQSLQDRVNTSLAGTKLHNSLLEELESSKKRVSELDELIKQAQNPVNDLQTELYWSRYYDQASNPDFETKSQYATTRTGQQQQNLLATAAAAVNREGRGPVYRDYGYADPLYDWINGDDDAGDIVRSGQWNPGYADGSAAGGYLDRVAGGSREVQQMTGEEKQIFNYLYRLDEDAGDREHNRAYQYLSDIQSDLTARDRAAEEKAARDNADENPFWASAATVLGGPERVRAYIGQAADIADDGKIDQNAAYNQASYINSAVRDQVASHYGPVGSFLYQTGMSMADFLFNTVMTGGFTGDAFLGGAQAAQRLALGIMGTEAAADSVIAAKDRGLSDGQSFALGTISGMAEILTEKVSIEALFSRQWEQNALKYVIKNVLAEGGEEVESDAINWLADVLIAKDKSEWMKSIAAYREEGKTPGQALGLAVRDQAMQMGLSFLGGAFSGGFTSGGNVVLSGGARNFNRNAREADAESRLRKLSDDYDRSSIVLANRVFDLSENASKLSREAWEQQWNLAREYGKLGMSEQDAADRGTLGGLSESEIAVAMHDGQRISRTAGTQQQTAAAEAEQQEAEATEATADNLKAVDEAAEPVDEAAEPVDEAAEPVDENAENVIEPQESVIEPQEPAIEQPESAVEQRVLATEETSSRQREAEAAPVSEQRQETEIPPTEERAATRSVMDRAETLGENGSRQFRAIMQETGERNARDIYDGYEAVYNAAINNRSMTAAESALAANIPVEIREQARAAAQADTTQTVRHQNPGLLQDDTFRKAKMKRSESRVLNALGIVTGTQIRFAENVTSEDGRDANAVYDRSTGTITISLSAEDPALTAAVHEVVHRIRNSSPGAYQSLARFVQTNMGESWMRAKSAYAESYGSDSDTVSEEVVADAFGVLMGREDILEQFVRDNRSAAQKFFDAIHDLIVQLQRTLGRSNVATSAEDSAAFSKLWSSMSEMERLLGNALEAYDQNPPGQAEIVDEFQQKKTGGTTKASVKGARKSLADAERANERLRGRVEYLAGQMKLTRGVKFDEKSIRTVAADLIRDYKSTANVNDLTEKLRALYTDAANNKITAAQMQQQATEVADMLSVGVDDEMYQAYEDLRKYLRGTTFRISKEDAEGIPDFDDFRKRNLGRVRIGGGTTNIDTFYQELQEQWPEFFNEDIQSNPEDQLLRIVEVADAIYNVKNIRLTDAYGEAVVTDIAVDAMSRMERLLPAKPTFADRAKQKQKDAFEAGKKRQAEIDKKRMQEGLSKIREKRDEKIRKIIKQSIQEKRDIREAQNAREIRAKIMRHASAMSKRLLNPTDSSNIPEELRKSVAAVLGAINLESRYDTVTNPDGSTRRVERRSDPKAQATKRTEAFARLQREYDAILREGDMVADPDIDNMFKEISYLRDTPIAAMNSEQLEMVWNLLKSVETTVANRGKMLAQSKFRTIVQLADAVRRESVTRKRKDRGGILQTTLDENADPYTFFYMLGNAGQSIFRTLGNARDQEQTYKTRLSEEVSDIMDRKEFGKFVKEAEEQTHEFDIDGTKLTMTTAQIMELYNLWKQGDARAHILSGGIGVRDDNAKNKRETKAVRVTEEQVNDILRTLDKEGYRKAREVADKLQGIMAGYLADIGNEASMKVYGYKKFKNQNYWSIHVLRSVLQVNPETNELNTKSIRNVGIAKNRIEGAKGGLDIGSAFDTFAQHSGTMIRYAAWLAPMEDMNRLYNFRYKDSNGNYDGENMRSVLTNSIGGFAGKYWENLMNDIQNGVHDAMDTSTEAKIMQVVNKTRGAAVGLNIRVVIQQPTAIMRAAFVLNPKYLTAGMAKGATPGSGWNKALKWAPIAQIKDSTGFDISATRNMRSALFGVRSAMDRLADISGAAAGKADAVTWGKIWNACELQTRATHNDLEVGTEEFYKETAKLFTEVIDQTQVVDGVLQRSALMRSSGMLNRAATVFKGEPTKTWNMFARAVYSYRNSEGSAKKAAAVNLTKTAFVLMANGILNAVAQSIADGWRDDDKHKNYWQRVVAALTGAPSEQEGAAAKVKSAVLVGNLGTNLFLPANIPYINDAISLLQGWDVSRVDAEVIKDIINSSNQLMKAFDGKGYRTTWYASEKMAAELAKVTGISVGNLFRDAWGISRTLMQASGNIDGLYTMERAMYAMNSGTLSRYADLAAIAMANGDSETFGRIVSDLKDNVGEDKVTSRITTAIKNEYENGGITSNQAIRYLKANGLEQEDAESKVNVWSFRKENPQFEASDATEAMINAYRTNGEPFDVSVDMFMDFWKFQREAESDKDGSKKAKVVAYIDSLPLSWQQKDALYLTRYSESTLDDAPW